MRSDKVREGRGVIVLAAQEVQGDRGDKRYVISGKSLMKLELMVYTPEANLLLFLSIAAGAVVAARR